MDIKLTMITILQYCKSEHSTAHLELTPCGITGKIDKLLFFR